MTDKERIAELEKENAELQQKYLEESYEKAKLVEELKEAEDIPIVAYLQGASRQNEKLSKENKDLQKRLDIAQGILDRDTEYYELKNNLEKAKHMLEIFVEEVGMLPGCYRTMIVDDTVLEAKRFLNWRI